MVFGLFDNTQPQRSSRASSGLDDLEDDLPDIDSIGLDDELDLDDDELDLSDDDLDSPKFVVIDGVSVYAGDITFNYDDDDDDDDELDFGDDSIDVDFEEL